MTTPKVLTSVAFVALIALSAAPVHAGQYRGSGGRSRGAVVSRGGPRVFVQSRGYSGRAFRGGVVRVVRPSFYRPYYSFRPRVSLGFGLWMGYPVPYPAYYGSPYDYAYPPVDPYAYAEPAPSYGYSQPYASAGQPSGYPSSNYPTANYPTGNYPAANYPPSNNYPPSSYAERQSAPAIGVQRGGEQSAGGISFAIAPDSAAVFVDGSYMGTAGEFGASAEPLGLSGGRHHVEIRAAGYRTMTFDADVRPGEVIPYQGTLQRN